MARRKWLTANPSLISLLRAGCEITYPGSFAISYDSKSNTVAYKEGLLPGSIPNVVTNQDFREVLIMLSKKRKKAERIIRKTSKIIERRMHETR